MTDQENLSALNGLHSDTWKYPKLMFLDKYPRCFILLKNRVFWMDTKSWLAVNMYDISNIYLGQINQVMTKRVAGSEENAFRNTGVYQGKEIENDKISTCIWWKPHHILHGSYAFFTMGMLNSVFPTFRFLPTYSWRRTSMMLKKSIVASGNDSNPVLECLTLQWRENNLLLLLLLLLLQISCVESLKNLWSHFQTDNHLHF